MPVRHGRMMVSPFTFYRGAAKVMAADLAGTPTAGLKVQLCGDAHLSNFGGFASPERQLLFGLNDFDETLPGPFEYDLKRMAASFTIAARNNGFTRSRSARGDGGVGAGVPVGDGGVRWDADAGRLVRPDVRAATSRRRCGPSRWRPREAAGQEQRARARTARRQGASSDRRTARRRPRSRRVDQGGEQGHAEGAHPRQPARPGAIRRGRRQPVPDRQPAADGGAVAGARRRVGPVRRTRSATWSTNSSTPTRAA